MALRLPINPSDFVGIDGDKAPRELLNRDKPPPPNLLGMEDHQVWVWMNGPGKPHYEIRGTRVYFG